jgi:catechol 2,3-dioxygenase-like lactoylglutathione lyase family enzyme
MFDHVSLVTDDFKRSRAFYDAALWPLGVRPLFEAADEGGAAYVGYGRDRPMFWLNTRGARSGPVHIAFSARTRSEVDAFHAAALAAGGRDNGGPRAAAAIPRELLRRVHTRSGRRQCGGGLPRAGDMIILSRMPVFVPPRRRIHGGSTAL